MLCKFEPTIRVVAIDYGSTTRTALEILISLERYEKVNIPWHGKNLGKGAALKTGSQYLVDQDVNAGTAGTLDADGQHLAKTILKVVRSSTEAGMPGLFDRTFGKNTPLRSFLRNRASSFSLSLLFGNRLGDRQTGLRAVPAGLERRWSC